MSNIIRMQLSKVQGHLIPNTFKISLHSKRFPFVHFSLFDLAETGALGRIKNTEIGFLVRKCYGKARFADKFKMNFSLISLETKEDHAREIDPKLLFPLKDWLYGFLPDHTFTWDIDESPPKVDDLAQRVLYIECVHLSNAIKRNSSTINE